MIAVANLLMTAHRAPAVLTNAVISPAGAMTAVAQWTVAPAEEAAIAAVAGEVALPLRQGEASVVATSATAFKIN